MGEDLEGKKKDKMESQEDGEYFTLVEMVSREKTDRIFKDHDEKHKGQLLTLRLSSPLLVLSRSFSQPLLVT